MTTTDHAQEADLVLAVARDCYEVGFGSRSMIQRHFMITFARAWGLLDELVDHGVLRPAIGSAACPLVFETAHEALTHLRARLDLDGGADS